MKNPLFKRIPKEFKKDFGKFTTLFLFLTLTIGFISGFLVADNSMKKNYDDSFETFSIENGHFSLAQKAEPALLEKLEKHDISVFPLFYKERVLPNGNDIRIFKMRKEVNRSDLMEGSYPKHRGEIVVDRLYAENNQLEIGDQIQFDDLKFTLTGTVALSDYSALFKNPNSLMFNAKKFTVALVGDDDFSKINEAHLTYCYAWVNQDHTLTDEKQMDKADLIKDDLIATGLLTDFVPRQENQAILFTGNDMGSDKNLVLWVFYVIICVLSFAFTVTTKSTIEDEASVIGTLLASGYTKSELIFHYMTPPFLLLLLSALVGNILGYTFMKNVVVGLYYHSYSLTNYVTLWNGDAFLLTTLAPSILLILINWFVLKRAFRISPLNFLRHELTVKKKQTVAKLPNWSILPKYRLRVIFQNRSVYITLFIGIFLSCVMGLFGFMMSPLIDHFTDEVLDSKLANYQYILKAPIESKTEGVEKFALSILKNEKNDEIMTYGISSPKFLELKDFGKENKVYISDGYMEKNKLKVGDELTLKEKYSTKEYHFVVAGKYDYPSSLAIFMSRKQYNKLMDKDKDYFTGYLSNTKIEDIPEDYIATVITEKDLTLLSEQMNDSMGAFFKFFNGFVVILFILIMYLLSKIIIEKNAPYISMIKILGYTNKEASKIYNHATGLVILVSFLISLPLARVIVKSIYFTSMQDFPGWLNFYLPHWIDLKVFAIGIMNYLLVYLLEKRKIKSISLAQALKNME